MSLKFSVVKSAGDMVSPAEQTPGGELSLSVIDQLPGLRRKVQTLHFFQHGEKVAEVMRAAIAKAMVQYYPLAGRLKESGSGPGALVLECSGEGIWLVEASVECNPKVEVADLIDGSCEWGTTLLFDLLPHPPMDKDGFDPLVLMQVTTFPCNGYVIGLEFSHVICDGLGAAQFLGAVAEFARGHVRLSIEPAWGREALLAKRNLSVSTAPPPQPPPPSDPDHSLKQATVDVHPTHIDELKREFLTQTGKTCSTFEVLTASVWKSRTEAIAVDKDAEVVLVFFANVRPFLDPPLPRGFYGNCFFPVNVKAAAGKIRDGSLADAVRHVQEAKSRVADEFKKWVDAGDGGAGGDPFLPPLAYTTLFVTEWGRLGFGGVDYGWGPPAYVMPIQYSNVVPGCVVASPPTPRKGVRLITWCVRDADLAAFCDGLVKKPARNGDRCPVFPVEHNDNENLH
ncbi:hypothetical protein H6P81_004472 [Aristolochia fimbriata]|uniref:Uncharacterized protein n=1 Tax=Aristolochia fimbriata TaxID=158543 RepID=A0AAV7FGZ9_ARIFI|nr:hypothetical protein H6P81_004472 [Aristolochia fimbriata]